MTSPDWKKNYNYQAYSCPGRLASLGMMEDKLRAPLNSLDHHSTMVLGGLRRTEIGRLLCRETAVFPMWNVSKISAYIIIYNYFGHISFYAHLTSFPNIADFSSKIFLCNRFSMLQHRRTKCTLSYLNVLNIITQIRLLRLMLNGIFKQLLSLFKQ